MLGGTPIQRQQWVPGMITGRVMAAFAMTEPEAGSDVAALQTSARREGEQWVIEGEKHLISNAGIADSTWSSQDRSRARKSRYQRVLCSPIRLASYSEDRR